MCTLLTVHQPSRFRQMGNYVPVLKLKRPCFWGFKNNRRRNPTPPKGITYRQNRPFVEIVRAGGWQVNEPFLDLVASLVAGIGGVDGTKSTNLDLRFTLTETPKRGSMSIYSTDLYRGVIIPIFGNSSFEPFLDRMASLVAGVGGVDGKPDRP